VTWVFALVDARDPSLAGSKAANLGVMARDLGLPVPPGFVITTEACRAYLAGGWPEGLDDEIRAGMGAIETAIGRRFGDTADPLLVSVRSGAPVSMPGMMNTILNLGLTPATTGAFAAACRARLDTMFRQTVGAEVPDDPWAQLRQAIKAVFRSWNGDRARAYRSKEGIPDDLGTGVVVQAMVFGNRGPDSGTGVLFTRNPATGERALYGDVMFDAQGEDVVAGTHATEPISVLNERMPTVAGELRAHGDRLERHYADMCDIEFTIEDGRLWLLQVRVGKRSPQAALRIAVDMAEDGVFPLSRADAVERVRPLLANPPVRATSRSSILRPLVTGLPASPGTASGEIATTPEAAVEAAAAGRSVILVRSETSPDDVHGMANAAGILTAKGGLASHAAVVARGWGIPAVVGASSVQVGDRWVAIGDRRFRAGDAITIDGGSGEVFEGAIPGTTEPLPDVATLLAWARELGISIGEDGGAGPAPGSGPATPARRASIDDLIRALGIKGFATAQGAADALATTPDQVQPLLDDVVVDGLAASVAGAYRLTDTGKGRASELVEAERTRWGAAADRALDAFLALDQQMKDTVTAWQLKAPDVVNDHADPNYDRGVLDRLAAIHGEAAAFLDANAGGSPRLATYRERLTRALDQAVNGDGRFVASPRVDSYHGVWFELHEDLIQLAGRTREDEVAAGRA
jgi:pyruvate,orthophosphate dikinase